MAAQHNKRGYLGEFGAGTDPTCLAALDGMLSFIDRNRDLARLELLGGGRVAAELFHQRAAGQWRRPAADDGSAPACRAAA